MNGDELTVRAHRVLRHIEVTLTLLLLTVGISVGLVIAIIYACPLIGWRVSAPAVELLVVLVAVFVAGFVVGRWRR